tara:strand:- start:7905 stop:8297 length:393 start_codon:yes stop_codon:yes gene_type:complete
MYIFIKKLCKIVVLIIFLGFIPSSVFAIDNDNWIKVQKQIYGEQEWNKTSVEVLEQKKLSVLTRFLSNSKNEKKYNGEQYYLMNIDCDKGKYKDLKVNGSIKEYATWETPKNDKLITDIIDQSCNYAFPN